MELFRYFFANPLRSSSFYKSEAKKDRQIKASNLNWRLSFLTHSFHKKPIKRKSSKNFRNNELFLLSFSFSSFLLEKNFKILKVITMLLKVTFGILKL